LYKRLAQLIASRYTQTLKNLLFLLFLCSSCLNVSWDKKSSPSWPSPAPSLHFHTNSVGFSKESILPPHKTSLSGFGGLRRRHLFPIPSQFCKQYEKALDTPEVRFLIFKGEETVVFVYLDLIAVTSDISIKLLKLLQDNPPPNSSFNLTLSHMHIFPSHTHSGPAGLSEDPFWSTVACDTFDSSYFEDFKEKIKTSYHNAYADLSPVNSLDIYQGTLDNSLVSNRLPDIPVDNRVIRIEWNTSNKSPCMIFFPMHSTWNHNMSLTKDIVGKSLDLSNRPCIAIMTSLGNVSHGDSSSLEDYSQKLEKALFESPTLKKRLINPKFSLSSQVIDLPKPQWNQKGCSTFPLNIDLSTLNQKTKLGLFSMDTMKFLISPGEISGDFSKTFENLYPNDTIIPVSIANDYIGYVLENPSYISHSLEACSSLYGETLSELLRKNFVKLIKEQ
jgi:hypothetical protein